MVNCQIFCPGLGAAGRSGTVPAPVFGSGPDQQLLVNNSWSSVSDRTILPVADSETLVLKLTTLHFSVEAPGPSGPLRDPLQVRGPQFGTLRCSHYKTERTLWASC